MQKFQEVFFRIYSTKNLNASLGNLQLILFHGLFHIHLVLKLKNCALSLIIFQCSTKNQR